MAADMAGVVAEILVEADLLGHDTHGVAQLPGYVKALLNGGMRGVGDVEILKDRGALALWDGNWLSGVWLTATALDAAIEKAQRFGIGAVSIRRAHHNACLEAYLERATSRGLVAIIAASDPSNASVAPFGGLDRVLGPDPIAIGIPTTGDPILIDTSASITTNGMTARLAAIGGRLPGKWLQDADGRLTDDPSVLRAERPGSLLLTGGPDHGHKGFGTALMVEALTHGLSGYGRRTGVDRWTESVFVQAIDPEFAAGLADFAEEMAYLAMACRNARPAPGKERVRLPGEAALARKRAALASGVPIRSETIQALRALEGQ
jgi:LDH2 family malate/lactate/ureidoglycolate dehydrogenase